MLSYVLGTIAGGTYSPRRMAVSHSLSCRLASHAGAQFAPVFRAQSRRSFAPETRLHAHSVSARMACAVERPLGSPNACSFASFRCKEWTQMMHYVNRFVKSKPFARSHDFLVNHANIITPYYITTYYYFTTTFLYFSRNSRILGTLYNTGLEILDYIAPLNVRDEKTRKAPFLPVHNYRKSRPHVTYSVRVENREFRANARIFSLPTTQACRKINVF